MKDFIIQLVGAYVIPEGLSGVAALDFPWIFGAILLVGSIFLGYWILVRLLVGIIRHD